MAYASTTHVEALNQGRPPLGTQGQPAATQVAQWLEETAGILDGLLAQRGYAVPVATTAATSALRTLQNFNAAGAWYYVERSAKTREKLQFEEAKRMWEMAQKMISEGMVELDLELDLKEALPRGGFSAASPAFFSREMEF